MNEIAGVRARIITALIGDVAPATDGLVKSLAESVQKRREHDHPKYEDFFCFNQVSWAGERTAYLIRRLLDSEAEVVRLRDALADAAKEPREWRACGEPADADGRIEHRPGMPCTTDYRAV